MVHKMAAEYGAKLVRFDQRFQELSQEMSMLELAEDGVHPSQLGHTIMADPMVTNCRFVVQHL